MATSKEIPGIDVLPIIDLKGHVLIYDLWVAGKWTGSRRTMEQCKLWLSYLCDTEIEAVPGNAW